jgi:predicted permease
MSVWSRLANALRSERLNREIDEELQLHIEEAIASGRDPDEARRAFGSIGSILRQREASHSIRTAGWLESLLADVRFGWRQLSRNKVTSVAAVLSLALGMGSCVAAFRLIDALLWRPLPVAHADRLFALTRQVIGFDGKPIEADYWATPDFDLMRDAVKGQANLIAASYSERSDLTFASDNEMEKAHVQFVSGTMFSLFGLQPSSGRLLTALDDRAPGAGPYAVLSWDYWNHRFSRDPHVIGRSFHIGNQVYEIVGVGPRSFTGTEPGTVTDIFLPTMMMSYATQRSINWQRTLVLVNAGVSIDPLRQKLAAVSHAFEAERAKSFHGMAPDSITRFLNQQVLIRPASAGASNFQQDYRRALGILGVLVAFVLLICCVNVANLMTAQAAARAHEMALRVSIGAGRGRLIQLILAQSGLLALFSAVLGAAFAAWSAPFILNRISPADTPVRLLLPADWRVLLFTIVLIAVVLLLLGLLPALRASTIQPVSALKRGEGRHSPHRMMRGAIAIQITFCLFVLLLSSLFVTTFEHLAQKPLGFSTDRLLLLDTVAQKGQPFSEWDQTLDAIRNVPGVRSSAISIWSLLQGVITNSFISINGAAPGPNPAFFLNITPGWLGTMRIPILQGSDFQPEDTGPGEAIVSETFARTFFPGQNPIGKTFKRAVDQGLLYRIVALVPDTPYSNLRDPMLPVAYIPLHEVDEYGLPYPISSSTFVVQTAAANPFALAGTLRQVVAQRHNGLRVSNVRTQAELVRDQTLRERLLAMLAVFFAVVTLLLAGIGLYGVLNYSVLQRRREIGIRLAIGSPRAGIVRLVTLDVFLMIAVGGCTGIALGLVAARYVESLFYQVKSTDGEMIALPACAILLTALVATLPAVLRALRTDPTEILRAE